MYDGGLSPELFSLEQLKKIARPTDVPDQGLLCDLLWADPDKDQKGWGPNDRGISVTFSQSVIEKFLESQELELICRAHQVISFLLLTFLFFCLIFVLILLGCPRWI